MIADLEGEYYSFLKCLWQRYSHETARSDESPKARRHLYNSVSSASNKFLRDKLKKLEEGKR
jgi:hypothetical protein